MELDELAGKGFQALTLTRADSDASVTKILPQGLNKPSIAKVVENATDIANVDVETFYERILAARSVHCRHTKH